MQEGLRRFTIVSWNVNYSARTVDQYEEFSFARRAELVTNTLKHLQVKEGNTLFLLQEVMPDYLPVLNAVFPENRYRVWTKQVHPCGRMLYTAIPMDYVSERDESIPPLGEEFRDCWDEIRVFIHAQDNFRVINVHAPMDKKYRVPICTHIAKCCRQHYYCIIAGDLNTFPDDGGREQIAAMEQHNTFKDANSLMLRSSLQFRTFEPSSPYCRVLQTFSPYPYDTIPKESPKYFPYHLDHILISGSFKSHETALCFDWERGLLFNDGNFYGASDHYPIALTLEM